MINKKIKEIREEKNLSLLCLSEKAGIDINELEQWENGTALPEAEKLTRLANALGVCTDQILDEENYSLHDCRCDHIEIKENGILFTCCDELYVLASSNSSQRRYLAGKCQAEMFYKPQGFDNPTIYLDIKQNENEILRKEISLPELCNMVNRKNCCLEFVTRYDSYWTTLFECEFWFNKKPYHQQVAIYIDLDHIDYRWETLSDCQQN